MTVPTEKYSLRWLTTGDAIFAAVLASIGAARASVRLETYIFGDDQAGRGVLGALVAAAGRGCAVQVLIDAVGSQPLSDHFWDPLRAVGGEVRWFNRSLLQRLPIRDHRKLVVIDDTIAFLGGFNFTEASEIKNAENLLILEDIPEITRAYQENFQNHLGHAVPYSGLEE